MIIIFSIIILTKDSIGIIERLVDALLSQDFNHEYEVIFMDNNSKDQTVDYLQGTPFKHKKIIHVPDGEFSHSGTRMKGAQVAEGKYVIFFTDDIIPVDKDFLNQLTRPVLENKAVATYGVCQVNPETGDPIDAYLHNNWWEVFPDVLEPLPRFYWDYLTPEQRRRLCNFDNCSSCMDKEVLLQIKLPDVPYGEDMLFAKRMLLNGHKLALSKGARFYHWHRVSFSYLLKRMCIDQYLSIPELGIYYVRKKLGVIKAIIIRTLHRTYSAFFKIKMPFSKKIYWSFYNLKTLTADFIGKYMGVLDETSIKGFSPINKRLMRKREKIVGEIYKKSPKRY